jgi:UDP-glucose:glycoprotein glucosyltransferase
VAQAAYERIAAASGKAHLPFEEVINQVEDEEQLAKYKQYTSRLLATRQESPHGHVFVNGKYAPFTLVSHTTV